MRRESAYRDRSILDKVAFVEIQDPGNGGTEEDDLAMALAFESFHLLPSHYLHIFKVINTDQKALMVSAQDLCSLI